MSLRLCLVAPLAAGIVISGCYDSSVLDPRSDAGAIAADAGADPSCGPRLLDLVCFSHLPAGTPTTIEIAAGLGGDCFCGQELACTARVSGDGLLTIDTQLCPELPVCRACGERAEGRCELPALTEGRWYVLLRGAAAEPLSAMQVDVVPAGTIPERGATCIRRVIGDSCGTSGEPQPFEVGRACHPSVVPEGARAEIRVFDACGGCQQIGPCRVDVFDDVIRVAPTRLANGCDIACPPACVEDEHLCITPHLEPGTYRVQVEGVGIEGSLTVGSGTDGEVCFGERAI